MIKQGGNYFKNLRVCLKTSQTHILNKACVKSCYVVKNLTFLRNMCTISLSFMLCRPSYAKPKDCSIMNRINPIYITMLPPLSEFPFSPTFQPLPIFDPFFYLFNFSLFSDTLTRMCASYIVQWAILIVWTLPRYLPWRGFRPWTYEWMRACLSFVFVSVCIVFVSVYICLCLCPVPFLTSSCFMSILILSFVTALYLLFCQLPTLGSLLLQKFKLSAILNDILILPSYWLVLPVIISTSSNYSLFYLFSNLVSKTMLLSQGFPRLVPRESNTGYMHSPFQFFYINVPNMKQEKWINMWTFPPFLAMSGFWQLFVQ